MKRDRKLQRCVAREIALAMPSVSPRIGVSVRHGTVMLSGRVDEHAHRQQAETIAFRCHGVHGLANEIDVGPASPILHDDESIALSVSSALAAESWELGQAIHVAVQNRWVTLHGTVPLSKVRSAAERIASRCAAVDGVTNALAVAAPSNRASESRTDP